MKKTLSLLLAFVLAFGVGASTSALAMMVVSSGASSQSVTENPPASIAAIGDTLYLLDTSGQLQRMGLDTRVKEPVGECLYTGYYASAEDVIAQREAESGDRPAISHLFAWEGQLYGFCALTGDWARLLDDVGSLGPAPMEPTLDVPALTLAEEDYTRILDINSLFAQEGKLYFAAMTYTSTGQITRLGQIDLLTGESRLYQTQNVTELAPWTDGKLMARMFDEASMYSGQADSIANAQYGLFDPKTDAFTPLGDFKADGNLGGYGIGGICTNPETGSVYYAMGGRVMGLDVATGESRVSAYTGAGMFAGSGSGTQILFADGHYIRKTYDDVKLYALDTEAVKDGALRIFGQFGSDAHNSFLRAYPDIPVDVGENYTNSLEELTSSMVSGAGAYDVLLLNMSYMPVVRMQEKGYCMELSQYPEIMEIVEQMYPKVVEPLKVDGKLFAVPVQMSSYTLGVNMELWTEELGLGEEDLPASFTEFLDFVANWEDDYGDDHGDLKLINGQPLRQLLFSTFFQNYITYMQFKGEDLRFDTPVMRALLAAFEGIPASEEKYGESVYSWDENSLFDPFHMISQFYSSWRKTTPLYLPLAPDAERMLSADLSVLIINPKTTRLEQAVLYVSHYLQNLDPRGENVTFFPGHNEAVKDKVFEQYLAESEAELEKQKSLLEAADESEKASLRERIQNLEDQIANDQEYLYLVTEEDIANYRENVYPLLFVTQMSAFLQSDTTELSKTLMQYLDGAMGQDQFLKEMDQRVRMMELEAK